MVCSTKASDEAGPVPSDRGRRPLHDQVVAAFPGPRLRHFQKQGSVKEELKTSETRVQVELKFRGAETSKRGGFGRPHWKCRNGRTPFASSNLARSATMSGSRRAGWPQALWSCEHDSGGRQRISNLVVAAFPENGRTRLGNAATPSIPGQGPTR